MMGDTLLSIVIPAYNRQEGLNRLLLVLDESILKGGFNQQVEIIVIDDCSDHCVELPELSCSIFLERNNLNKGAPFSRKKGFELSKGRFVHFHDSDDSVANDWLLKVIEELDDYSDLDLLVTARIVQRGDKEVIRSQKFFHKNTNNIQRIQKRLVYRNCVGPLVGVTYSRRVLEKTRFMNFSSSQDWQMHCDAIKYAKVLRSRPDIYFLLDDTGSDRISANPRKKILGFSQLAKITAPRSIFKNAIRLFYLRTCKEHVVSKGGAILKLYNKNRLGINLVFIVISLYWRIT